jgi:hypothetical protein
MQAILLPYIECPQQNACAESCSLPSRSPNSPCKKGRQLRHCACCGETRAQTTIHEAVLARDRCNLKYGSLRANIPITKYLMASSHLRRRRGQRPPTRSQLRLQRQSGTHAKLNNCCHQLTLIPANMHHMAGELTDSWHNLPLHPLSGGPGAKRSPTNPKRAPWISITDFVDLSAIC